MRKYALFVLVAALLTPAAFAQSAVSTNTDNVTANVNGQCRIATFTLAFGVYDGVVANATTPLDTNAPVNVYCTRGVNPTSIAMGNGTPTFMINTDGSGNTLSYEVYSDSGYSSLWTNASVVDPNASVSKNTALVSGGAANTPIVAYGRIPQDQDVTVGSYVGTIQATVNF